MRATSVGSQDKGSSLTGTLGKSVPALSLKVSICKMEVGGSLASPPCSNVLGASETP